MAGLNKTEAAKEVMAVEKKMSDGRTFDQFVHDQYAEPPMIKISVEIPGRAVFMYWHDVDPRALTNKEIMDLSIRETFNEAYQELAE